jgi:hypothetical protein
MAVRMLPLCRPKVSNVIATPSLTRCLDRGLLQRANNLMWVLFELIWTTVSIESYSSPALLPRWNYTVANTLFF